MTNEEKRAKNAEKSRKRRAELEEAAALNGFDNWSAMLTYIKNEAKEGRMAVVKSGFINHDVSRKFEPMNDCMIYTNGATSIPQSE